MLLKLEGTHFFAMSFIKHAKRVQCLCDELRQQKIRLKLGHDSATCPEDRSFDF